MADSDAAEANVGAGTAADEAGSEGEGNQSARESVELGAYVEKRVTQKQRQPPEKYTSPIDTFDVVNKPIPTPSANTGDETAAADESEVTAPKARDTRPAPRHADSGKTEPAEQQTGSAESKRAQQQTGSAKNEPDQKQTASVPDKPTQPPSEPANKRPDSNTKDQAAPSNEPPEEETQLAKADDETSNLSADPSSEDAVDPEALNALLSDFTDAYDEGNISKLVSVLSPGVTNKEGAGRTLIAKEYQRLFKVTDMRKMTINFVSWAKDRQKVRGKVDFHVKVREKGSADVRSYDGVLHLDVMPGEEGMVITRLDYQYK
jgi:hypothetical protein